MECSDAAFSVIYPFITRYAERFIKEADFRDSLYEYIVDAPEEYLDGIKSLRIIPVYSSENDSTIYISWEKDSIFVKPNSLRSGDNYYVLNEKILPKSKYEDIYSTNINEMSPEWERNRYNNKLEEMLKTESDISTIYSFLLSEYRAGKLLKNDSFRILSAYRIPLKNQSNEIT